MFVHITNSQSLFQLITDTYIKHNIYACVINRPIGFILTLFNDKQSNITNP